MDLVSDKLERVIVMTEWLVYYEGTWLIKIWTFHLPDHEAMPQTTNLLSLHWEPSQNQSLVSWCWPVLHSSLLDSKILASFFLFPLLLKSNCWVCRILWCGGNIMAPVTSLLPRLFYIWGYFRPWVWSIAGRYQMHQVLRCADPHQVTGNVDPRHSQELSGIWWLGVRSPAAGSSTPHSACQIRHHCVSLDWIRLVLFRFRKV